MIMPHLKCGHKRRMVGLGWLCLVFLSICTVEAGHDSGHSNVYTVFIRNVHKLGCRLSYRHLRSLCRAEHMHILLTGHLHCRYRQHSLHDMLSNHVLPRFRPSSPLKYIFIVDLFSLLAIFMRFQARLAHLLTQLSGLSSKIEPCS